KRRGRKHPPRLQYPTSEVC
ncbi:unnamed protein product, partial [Rotaria sordida]